MRHIAGGLASASLSQPTPLVERSRNEQPADRSTHHAIAPSKLSIEDEIRADLDALEGLLG